MSFYQYFQLPGFEITNLRQVNSETIYMAASSNSTKAECPYCQTVSNRRHILRLIAIEISAEATARISEHLNMSVSADTILRILRATSLPERACPRVLGIDDWAVKRGQNYGTILIDLETHKAVELLPDRTADTVKEWLQSHPEVEIIARDRSKEYKVGMDATAPHAIQVVDLLWSHRTGHFLSGF